VKAPKAVIPVIAHMEELNLQKSRTESEYKEMRSLLEAAFKKFKEDLFEYDDGQEKILKAMKTTSTSVSYDVETLHEMLPKDVFKKISVVSVDPKKVEAMFDAGLIDLKVLQAASQIRTSTVICVKRTKPTEKEC
jgi:uncharacterized protein (DUF885 family)